MISKDDFLNAEFLKQFKDSKEFAFFNSHGFTTRRGKQFFPITVQRLYQRHKQLSVEPLYL